MSAFELVTVKKLRNHNTYKDAIEIVYYEDGVKKVKFIENPTVKFHTTKLEAIDKYIGTSPMTLPIEDTEEIEVAYSEVYDEIIRLQADFDPESAEENFNYLKLCRKNRVSPESLLLLNHVHGIDADIVDHYIGRFIRAHEKDIVIANLRKGYFDIETNNRAIRRFVPAEEHSTPVNAISFFDKTTRTEVIRLLDNGGPESQYIEFNPQIEEFKKHLEENRLEIEKEINKRQKEIFKDANLPDVKVIIKFYDDEIKMITDHYKDIRDVYKIDYLMAWNQEFDINFTLSRVRDAKSYEYLCNIISDDAIPDEYRDAYYHGDFKAKDIAKRNDNYKITSAWDCLDQQYVYFKIRESMKKPEEYTLDYALSVELGIHKVQHDCEMADYPYYDYKEFVLYSGIDTMGLYWLDEKTADIDTMIMLGNLSRTRVEKSMTKTIMLRNLLEYFFRDNMGLILSNNRVKIRNKIQQQAEKDGKKYNPYPELDDYLGLIDNKDKAVLDILNEEDEEDEEESEQMEDETVEKVQKKKVKFRGAFVADPNYMSPMGVEILGKLSSLIFDMVADSDLSSLYPNLKIAWNIYVETMIGKIYPKYNVKDINFSSELADYIVSRDNIAIGKKYFGFPDQEELLAFFDEVG